MLSPCGRRGLIPLLLAPFLLMPAQGEQVCRGRSIFGPIVEYRCPEFENSILEYCCGPSGGITKCCPNPNKNLKAEEEQMIARGYDVESLLYMLVVFGGTLLLCSCCCYCWCKNCSCCPLAKRRKEKERREREEEEQVPLEPLETMPEFQPGYTAPPWPPQNSTPQVWSYDQHQQSSGGFRQQSYNIGHSYSHPQQQSYSTQQPYRQQQPYNPQQSDGSGYPPNPY